MSNIYFFVKGKWWILCKIIVEFNKLTENSVKLLRFYKKYATITLHKGALDEINGGRL